MPRRPTIPRRSYPGRCNLCGHRTLFVVTSRRRLERSDAACVRCRSLARTRHVAHCAVQAFAGRGIESFDQFASRAEFRILNTSSGTPIARALGDAKHVEHTEFFADTRPGDSVNGVRCEDLTRLTYDDDSFDLLVTEDVLEHVPDQQAARRELARVVKPGGVHVFTVPFGFASATTELFDVVDGGIVLREPIEYHGDLSGGRVETFFHFGWDLVAAVEESGFDVAVRVADHRLQHEIGAFDCVTFVARRRADASSNVR